jgi:hypothetical protein
MRSILLTGIISLLVGIGCSPNISEPVEEDLPPKQEPLACILRGERTCELGKTPNITVELINQTNKEIYLVGNLDYSDYGMRYPYCYFEITGPDGESADRRRGPGCGTMNPLRVEEFVKVPPGGTFNPHQKIDRYGFWSSRQLSPDTFREPGVYRIRFLYSTKNNTIDQWAGSSSEVAANAEIMRLFNQVPKVEVHSNEFVLTVIAPETKESR